MTRLMLGMCLLYPVAATGQGSFGGQVISQFTQAPILAAVVELTLASDSADATHLSATTDSSGRFLFATLDAGTYRVEIHAIGYEQGAWRLRITPGRPIQHAFDLVPLTVKLAPVVVEGAQRHVGRLADFERRRTGKVGYFITQQDIENLNASNLADVLATVRGITLDCTAGVCIARMARARPGCDPQYFIDGVESSSYFARNTPPHDVIGIEVYRGPSELPAEFTGSNSGCGVIVIWTKSSP
ncbi:MAG TPA: TonB-dependent receptor [Gemmatimonadales bacterium]|nr:TonB-dependent receptor [Gemmatimonadales bacterium]